MLENLKNYYLELSEHHFLATFISVITIFIVVLFISYLVSFIINRAIVNFIKSYLNKSESNIASMLIKHDVFKRLSNIAPGIFIFFRCVVCCVP